MVQFLSMPRWKTTQSLLSDDREYFDENWMNYESIDQYSPKGKIWNEKRKIQFQDVDLWEIISEWGGPGGIYAAWSPYAHYFIVIHNYQLVHEFWGISGEKELQKFMKKNNIPFSKNKVWIEDCEMKYYLSEDL